MNSKRFNILRIFVFLAYFGVLSLGCHKDPEPTFYGRWETVTTTGFEFEYQIDQGGEHCRRLPEYFGQTSFCYPFTVQADDVLIVNGNQVETWVWEFLDDDVADVTVTYEDQTKQRFILKKLK